MSDYIPENEEWRGKEYAFFSHVKCEAFPCHETEDRENFNCLFCYCPLYYLGKDCGGDYLYLPSGVKDCTNCLIPHIRDNYGHIAKQGDGSSASQSPHGIHTKRVGCEAEEPSPCFTEVQ